MIMSAIISHRIPLSLTLWPPILMDLSIREKRQKQDNIPWRICLKLLSRAFDFTLMKKKIFTLFCVGSFFQSLFITAYHNHLPSFTVYKGHTLYVAAFIIFVHFITNISTRLATSFISNMKCVNLLVMYTFGNVVGSLSILPLLVLKGYPGLITSAVLAGVMMGRLSKIHCRHLHSGLGSSSQTYRQK